MTKYKIHAVYERRYKTKDQKVHLIRTYMVRTGYYGLLLTFFCAFVTRNSSQLSLMINGQARSAGGDATDHHQTQENNPRRKLYAYKHIYYVYFKFNLICIMYI